MADLSYLIDDEMSMVNWVGGWPQASNESSMVSIGGFEIYAASIVIMVAAAVLTIRYLRKRNHVI
jgi:hypothetical protein